MSGRRPAIQVAGGMTPHCRLVIHGDGCQRPQGLGPCECDETEIRPLKAAMTEGIEMIVLSAQQQAKIYRLQSQRNALRSAFCCPSAIID
jgi:hypothetical protein